MRTYEFTPFEDSRATVLAISINEPNNGECEVSTVWRDYDRHLQRAKKTDEEGQKFMKQILNFWHTVCRMENKYKSGMVEKILDSIVDPDLKEFLVQYS